jgi:hypothetical protein
MFREDKVLFHYKEKMYKIKGNTKTVLMKVRKDSTKLQT